MGAPRFGLSTHLFRGERLGPDHLATIADHGFPGVEVVAAPAHFDYRDGEALSRLGDWLATCRLDLLSLHAPLTDAVVNGRWTSGCSTASGDEDRRRAAVAEARVLIDLAARVPYRHLVLHLGVPVTALGASGAGVNQPAAARRSLEEIVDHADGAGTGVRVAVEIIPNPLSGATALVDLIDEDLDGIDAGICLDYGHAHLSGDLADAIEAVGGHLLTTHLHDNGGRRDDHLVPFAGAIDWSAAMMESQKVGYDGPFVLEVAGGADTRLTLRQAARARERLSDLLVTA